MAGSHQGRRLVAGPSAQSQIWHLEDVTCPDGSRRGEEGGQGDFIQSQSIWTIDLRTEASGDFYIPQRPQQENCPQPPTKQGTWGQGEVGS